MLIPGGPRMHQPNQVPTIKDPLVAEAERAEMGAVRRGCRGGLSLELSLERSSELPVWEVARRRRGGPLTPSAQPCTCPVLIRGPHRRGLL